MLCDACVTRVRPHGALCSACVASREGDGNVIQLILFGSEIVTGAGERAGAFKLSL